MVSQLEVAYFAGLMDGDGCIRMQRQHSGRWYPRLYLTQSTRTLCDWVADRWGGQVRFQRQANAWTWTCTDTQRARSILLAIEPYLILKRTEAKLVLIAYEKRRTPSFQEDIHNRLVRIKDGRRNYG